MHGATTSVFAPPEDRAARNAPVAPPRCMNGRPSSYEYDEIAGWRLASFDVRSRVISRSRN